MRLFGLLFLMAPALLCGQAETLAAPEAFLALEQADSCVQSEDYKAARALYLEALPYFITQDAHREQSYIYLWLSETSYYARDLDQAMKEALYSRLLAESCLNPDTLPFYCTILQNLGVFHSARSDFDGQMRYYLQSLEAALQYHGKNSARAADAYLSVGAAYGRRGRWNECIAFTENSLQIARDVNYREGIGSALLNLSYSYAEQEDFEKAIQLQIQALSVTTSLEERARGLNNLGVHYIDIGEYDEALGNLHRALHLRRALYLPSDGDVFSTLLNISRAHSENGRLDSASYYLEQAIQGLLQQGNDADQSLLQIAYNYKGKLLLEGGLPEAAEQAIRQALAVRGNWRGVNSSTFMLMGEVLLALGRYDQALQAAQEGLEWAAPGFEAEGSMENPPWERLESIAQARGLLKLKGDILRESGLASGEPTLLKASLATFEQGDSLVMWLRRSFRSRLSRDQMAANANELYAGALRTLYHLYQQTGDTAYFDQALAFSEKNKALSVLENLNSLYARSFSGVPDDVVEAERRLLEEIEFYSNLAKLNRGYESDSLVAAWENLAFEKRRQQDSLLSRVEVQYPHYYQMKHGFQLAGVRPLQEELLAQGETLLEYFWDEDAVFVFLLSGKQRQFFRLPALRLADKTGNLCRLAIEQGPEFYERSFELYQLLFQPLEPYIKGEKLAIVPDDILAYLPFEMLLTEPVPAESLPHARRPYLLKKYSIRNLFSANAALQAQYNQAAVSVSGELLALAPSFDGDASGLANLPGARDELDILEEGYQGLFLQDTTASEANFRKYCRRYGIYHIATHTRIDQSLPAATHLLLEAGGGQDGKLHVFELYNLRLDAELAVLSACNTGIGKIRVGEGSASLAHAFAYAGCSDLVMSLWPVQDRTTPVLIKRYYDNMAEGMDRCEALRQAKLHCLEYDELFAHPYYWSGFIYVGSREELFLKKRTGLTLWPLLLLLGLIAAGLTIVLIRRGNS
ncbi:MAG: CHAT domain-containing protein [Lewinellaceae bacterium]|nr:CHAT domain-containing protein [Phaeodactylibacter sp.]MCB9040321.1 CHAT domain-containing protein [Lewinellaceae bacterium]